MSAPMNDTVDFACELIRCASVTPDDAGCQQLIAERLRPAGFDVETMQIGEVTNLWARRGKSAPLLCFAGHTDVVPAGPRADGFRAFRARDRDGVLYGRGQRT